MKELWKTIIGFEGIYEVSSLGNVRGLQRIVRGVVVPEKIMSPRVCVKGYKSVGLNKNGVQYHKSVHRLVANAFIPNPDNKPCVNHIDGNPSNNKIENLEWATHRENRKHYIEILSGHNLPSGIYKKDGFYRVNLSCKFNRYFLGSYKTFGEAFSVRTKAEEILDKQGEEALIEYKKSLRSCGKSIYKYVSQTKKTSKWFVDIRIKNLKIKSPTLHSEKEAVEYAIRCLIDAGIELHESHKKYLELNLTHT